MGRGGAKTAGTGDVPVSTRARELAATLSSNALAVTVVFGGGRFGQLGVGDKRDELLPVLTAPFENCSPQDGPVSSACSQHTIVVSDSGSVWSSGNNEYGELGLGNFLQDIASFHHVKALCNVQITKVACGWRHTLALSNDSQVFSWGMGDSGQLGIGSVAHESTPQLIKALSSFKIVDIACGWKHSCAVTDNGMCYSWGDSQYGQLGLGDRWSRSEPTLIDSNVLRDVREVSCGGHHTVALTVDQRVWSWGGGAYGQLGHGNRRSLSLPRLIERLDHIDISHIACGWRHSAALTETGRVYVWGNNASGQLGLGDTNSIMTPSLVDALSGVEVVKIACGDDHMAAVSMDSNLYTWGKGGVGQLGHGDRVDYVVPKLVDDLCRKRIYHVSCGASHTVVITGRADRIGASNEHVSTIQNRQNETLSGFEPSWQRPVIPSLAMNDLIRMDDSVADVRERLDAIARNPLSARRRGRSPGGRSPARPMSATDDLPSFRNSRYNDSYAIDDALASAIAEKERAWAAYTLAKRRELDVTTADETDPHHFDNTPVGRRRSSSRKRGRLGGSLAQSAFDGDDHLQLDLSEELTDVKGQLESILKENVDLKLNIANVTEELEALKLRSNRKDSINSALSIAAVYSQWIKRIISVYFCTWRENVHTAKATSESILKVTNEMSEQLSRNTEQIQLLAGNLEIESAKRKKAEDKFNSTSNVTASLEKQKDSLVTALDEAQTSYAELLSELEEARIEAKEATARAVEAESSANIAQDDALRCAAAAESMSKAMTDAASLLTVEQETALREEKYQLEIEVLELKRRLIGAGISVNRKTIHDLKLKKLTIGMQNILSVFNGYFLVGISYCFSTWKCSVIKSREEKKAEKEQVSSKKLASHFAGFHIISALYRRFKAVSLWRSFVKWHEMAAESVASRNENHRGDIRYQQLRHRAARAASQCLAFQIVGSFLRGVTNTHVVLAFCTWRVAVRDSIADKKVNLASEEINEAKVKLSKLVGAVDKDKEQIVELRNSLASAHHHQGLVRMRNMFESMMRSQLSRGFHIWREVCLELSLASVVKDHVARVDSAAHRVKKETERATKEAELAAAAVARAIAADAAVRDCAFAEEALTSALGKFETYQRSHESLLHRVERKCKLLEESNVTLATKCSTLEVEIEDVLRRLTISEREIQSKENDLNEALKNLRHSQAENRRSQEKVKKLETAMLDRKKTTVSAAVANATLSETDAKFIKASEEIQTLRKIIDEGTREFHVNQISLESKTHELEEALKQLRAKDASEKKLLEKITKVEAALLEKKRDSSSGSTPSSPRGGPLARHEVYALKDENDALKTQVSEMSSQVSQVEQLKVKLANSCKARSLDRLCFLLNSYLTTGIVNSFHRWMSNTRESVIINAADSEVSKIKLASTSAEANIRKAQCFERLRAIFGSYMIAAEVRAFQIWRGLLVEAAKKKAEDDAVKALVERNKAKEETAKALTESNEAKEETAKALAESNKAKEEAAKAFSESNKAKEEAAKAFSESNKAKEEAADAQEVVAAKQDVIRKLEKSMEEVEDELLETKELVKVHARAEKEAEELREAIGSISGEARRAAIEKMELSHSASRYQTEALRLGVECERLQKDLTVAAAQAATYARKDQALEKLKNDYDLVVTSNAAAEAKRDILADEIKELRSIIREKESALMDAESRERRYKAELAAEEKRRNEVIAEADRALFLMEEDKKSIFQKLLAAESALGPIKSSGDAALQSKIDDLQLDFKAATESIRVADAAIVTGKRERDVIKSQLERFETDVKRMNEREKELLKTISVNRAEIDDLSQELRKAERSVSSSDEQVSMWRKKCASLEDQLSKLQVELSDSQWKLSMKNQELEEKEELVSGLTSASVSRFGSLSDSATSLKQALADRELELKRKESAITEYEQSLRREMAKYREMEDKAQRYKIALKTKTTQLKRALGGAGHEVAKELAAEVDDGTLVSGSVTPWKSSPSTPRTPTPGVDQNPPSPSSANVGLLVVTKKAGESKSTSDLEDQICVLESRIQTLEEELETAKREAKQAQQSRKIAETELEIAKEDMHKEIEKAVEKVKADLKQQQSHSSDVTELEKRAELLAAEAKEAKQHAKAIQAQAEKDITSAKDAMDQATKYAEGYKEKLNTEKAKIETLEAKIANIESRESLRLDEASEIIGDLEDKVQLLEDELRVYKTK